MVNIYRTALPITETCLKQVKVKTNSRLDFRIMPAALKLERMLGDDGSDLRPATSINPGREPVMVPPLRVNEISALEKADEFSIVGEVASFSEGLGVLVSLIKAGITSPEFLVGQDADSHKIFVVKGKDICLPPGFSMKEVSCPFIPTGPVFHTHKEGALPSIEDFIIPLMLDSFGIVVGYDGDQDDFSLQLSKFYSLGPFAVFESHTINGQAINTLDILAKESWPKKSISCITYNGVRTGVLFRFLREYKAQILNLEARIGALEKELYSNPIQDLPNAANLYNLYLEAGYLINALIFLKKIIILMEGKTMLSGLEQKMVVSYVNLMSGSAAPIDI